MTEDSKQILLDYVMGQINEETGENIPYFDSPVVFKNNFKDNMEEETSYFTLEGTVASNTSELIVGWGYYGVDGISDTTIVILDRKFNVLKSFQSYDSGTAFERIKDLKVNSEGAFYMLETAWDESWTRLVMLNDITDSSSGDYKCTLRTTYHIPSDYSDYEFERVDKALNNAYYAFLGVNGNNYGMVTLKVNVGESNEWGFAYRWVSEQCTVKETLLVWGDTLSYTVYLDSLSSSTYWEIYFSEATSSDEVEYWADLTSVSFPSTGWLGTNMEAVKSLGGQNVYFLFTGMTFEGSSMYAPARLYKLNYSTSSFDLIQELTNAEGSVISGQFQVDSANNLFLGLFKPDTSVSSYKGQIFKITSGTSTTEIVATGEFELDEYDGMSEIQAVALSRCFELNTIVVQYNNYCVYATMQLLDGGYNGQPFVDRNSLNATAATIYSGGEKVMARTLYNKTINASTTTSTIEVPANYLNDMSLERKNLLSKNNNAIISNEDVYEKNEYEDVYFNFINTIYVQDRNNDNNITNQPLSNQITNSINEPANYETDKLTKFKVNYTDGASTVARFSITSGTLTYNINFAFFLEKEASTLELISEDENTSYLSIDISNLETNHIYNLSQDVSVE